MDRAGEILIHSDIPVILAVIIAIALAWWALSELNRD